MIVVRLPKHAAEPFVKVVSQYKHVGSMITDDGSVNLECQYRACSGMVAYVPIAGKVFGSRFVSVDQTLKFASS